MPSKNSVTAIILVSAVAACAAGTGEGAPSQASSAGGGGAAQASSTASGGGSSGGSGGSQVTTCGNGELDPGEPCDGALLGGSSCKDLGFVGGTLSCNASCGYDLSMCIPNEVCDNFVDDDQDGLVDCDDAADCAAAPSCAAACNAPKAWMPLQFDSMSGTTIGQPSTEVSSCAPSSGPEAIFDYKAAKAGYVAITLTAEAGFDVVLSVRTACGDAKSEIACSNTAPASFDNPPPVEYLLVPVSQGDYYVMVDSATPNDLAGFTLTIKPVSGPESHCDDFVDDDLDGLVDCQDPDCEALAACVPGPSPTGAPCSKPSDCQANANDPICMTPAYGFPSGYCSEFCDPNAGDCGPSAVCVENYGIGEAGAPKCLATCVVGADCRKGYACSDLLGPRVCLPQ